MINGKNNPVEWALWGCELEETIEHLQDIADQVTPDATMDEEEFKYYIGHVYAHLNRIYHSRNHIGDISLEQFKAYSTTFPTDMAPYLV